MIILDLRFEILDWLAQNATRLPKAAFSDPSQHSQSAHRMMEILKMLRKKMAHSPLHQRNLKSQI